MQVPALPSLGFPGVQFQNIGEVDNNGVELEIKTEALRSSNADVRLGFKVSHNNNKVITLGGASSLVMNATFGQYHVPGFPLGSIFQRRIVSADLDKSGATPKAVNMMCESGPLIPGTNFSRGGGPPVACLQAPAVYWGNPLPSWEGSTSATDASSATAVVQPWAEAGATWWIESDWDNLEVDHYYRLTPGQKADRVTR